MLHKCQVITTTKLKFHVSTFAHMSLFRDFKNSMNYVLEAAKILH